MVENKLPLSAAQGNYLQLKNSGDRNLVHRCCRACRRCLLTALLITRDPTGLHTYYMHATRLDMAGKNQREESSSFPPSLGRREEGPEPVVLG